MIKTIRTIPYVRPIIMNVDLEGAVSQFVRFPLYPTGIQIRDCKQYCNKRMHHPQKVSSAERVLHGEWQ